MLTYTPKLNGWQPDATMPDASSHVDLKYSDVASRLAAVGANVTDPAVETNGVLDLRKWCSPVENQGQIGSCVGNSVVGCLEFLEIREGKPLIDLSRLFVYYNARLMSGMQAEDSGAFIRLAMGTLSSIGTCAESKWPYDTMQVFTRPSWGSYREAYAHKIGAFYSINSAGSQRIEDIKNALRAQHPVVFGMIIDQDYMNYSGGVLAMPKANRVNPGGHAQAIVGFDDNLQCFIVRNSWGDGWGEGGYCYVPYAYLDASDANDFWVPTAV